MKIYRLTFTEIDTKQKLKDNNKKLTLQYNISDKQLKDINEEFKEEYFNYIKKKLFEDTANAAKLDS